MCWHGMAWALGSDSAVERMDKSPGSVSVVKGNGLDTQAHQGYDFRRLNYLVTGSWAWVGFG
jgi:hypothetical protein